MPIAREALAMLKCMAAAFVHVVVLAGGATAGPWEDGFDAYNRGGELRDGLDA